MTKPLTQSCIRPIEGFITSVFVDLSLQLLKLRGVLILPPGPVKKITFVLLYNYNYITGQGFLLSGSILVRVA